MRARLILTSSQTVTIQDINEVADPPVPVFNFFDFPIGADSTQAEQNIFQPPSPNSPVDNDSNIDVPDEETSLADFEAIQIGDFLNLDEAQEEALIQDTDAYESEFVLMNHPFHIAGIKVNRKGQVILDVDEETLKTSRLCFIDREAPIKKDNSNRVSKQNWSKSGPIVSFQIFRNHAWLKVGDFHLATEVVKTFKNLGLYCTILKLFT